MTDRRVKEYIIGKDAVAEFVKTVQEWKFQKDWQKKGLIFNPETGISEDGTMRDCLFRPWINKPKKEKKMNRAEAISEIDCVLFEQDHLNRKEVMKALKQPVTLADFLGWEEGQEYEWRGDIFRINSDILQVWDKDDERWYDSTEELNDYLRLRQARKVEQAKLKAWHVKDEYSFNCLMKEIDKGFVFVHSEENYIYEKDHGNGRKYYYWTEDFEEIKDTHDLIEYQKEEPKYYAMIKLPEKVKTPPYLSFEYGVKESGVFKLKGWVELNEIDAMAKSEWLEYGITDDNAEFERVE